MKKEGGRQTSHIGPGVPGDPTDVITRKPTWNESGHYCVDEESLPSQHTPTPPYTGGNILSFDKPFASTVLTPEDKSRQ
ncbi:hypothetical protein T265_14899, partial [Opisthorchis viverrini]